MTNKKEPKLSEMLDAFLDQMEEINKSIEQLETLKSQFLRINFSLSNIKISPDISNLKDTLKNNNEIIKNLFINHLDEFELKNKKLSKIKNNQSSILIIAMFISCLTTLFILFIYNKIEMESENNYQNVKEFFDKNPSNREAFYEWEKKKNYKKGHN